jgi:rod shape-determining protein MreC
LRNIFQFIRRYFTFLSFLVLQSLALYFLFRYNKFHEAAFLNTAAEFTGRFNRQYSQVDEYFHLREENYRIHRLNDSLLNLLPGTFIVPDSNIRLITDTVKYDTSRGYRHFLFRDARVVRNSTTSDKNYLQLDRGSEGGIREGMTVIGAGGTAVGVIVNVSPHFSQVMSLLHVQSKVNVMMKKTGTTGRVEWNPGDGLLFTLRNIPKTDSVKIGEAVLTSSYSNFPPGYMVGSVVDIKNDQSTNFYVLKIRPATNYRNLQRVHVVQNLQKEEMDRLDEETRKRINELTQNQ